MPSQWHFFRNRLPIHVPGPSYRATRGYFIGREREEERTRGRAGQEAGRFTFVWDSRMVQFSVGCENEDRLLVPLQKKTPFFDERVKFYDRYEGLILLTSNYADT